ncbi:hypothetical protein BKK79_21370 [Cupriavidus sp. USMAA2-4]|uniref:hypothetical protein n=1 Tax=Cupriavidus sp. USMAA2-4 TaxID=876364 RepID=UPI0008A70CAC|nr:hypothetical protein [Cupriavidus sp. USMAA2-4]AOY94498.1 hypothetical protein BKK79_21370 [Cupriavidus sp. USMAA2-4]
MQDNTSELPHPASDLYTVHLAWLRLAIACYREYVSVAITTLSEPYRAGWIEWDGRTYYYVCGLDAHSALGLGQVFSAATHGTLVVIDPAAYPPALLSLFPIDPRLLCSETISPSSLAGCQQRPGDTGP